MGTRATLFKKLCWSLFWLYIGRTPTEDSDNNPLDGGGVLLAGGWRATLWALCQDLEALAEELGLKSSSRTDPCNWCEADESTKPWIHCDPDAAWLGTVWTGRAWIAKMKPECELFSLPGVTVTTCAPDHMHNKILGLDTYNYGSATKYLICYLMPGTIEENEDAFIEDLKQAYKDARIFIERPPPLPHHAHPHHANQPWTHHAQGLSCTSLTMHNLTKKIYIHIKK